MKKRVKKTRKKSTAKTTGVELIVQEHGGALATGGTPGNAGGLGRPPAMIREVMRGDFFDRAQILRDMADGKLQREIMTKEGPMMIGPSHSDSRAAIDLMGKYGGIEKITIEQEKPPQAEGTGEQVMAKVMSQLVRAALSATEVQRLAMIRELEQTEGT